MTVPDFDVSGVPVRRQRRSLTQAGRVLVQDGRLALLTSYGREIDGAPVSEVRLARPWFAELLGVAGRTVVTLRGKRYALRLPRAAREGLAGALGVARERAAKIAAHRRIVHP
ncbi:hypothetical protein JJV70_08245 [Streptomyces sp. JJ66]|uniref:hypothetical protein n=1 Tax=Streptomyces sp. JJ66 TaxID=2803843 RepID=UPI001C561A38|nr:hypothetical protein [Streptomyces sp. JJ66]MBW1602103.1 hypothetical protein [Streptomyces sp. JJ66]